MDSVGCISCRYMLELPLPMSPRNRGDHVPSTERYVRARGISTRSFLKREPVREVRLSRYMAIRVRAATGVHYYDGRGDRVPVRGRGSAMLTTIGLSWQLDICWRCFRVPIGEPTSLTELESKSRRALSMCPSPITLPSFETSRPETTRLLTEQLVDRGDIP